MKASRGVLLVALSLLAIAALRDVARLGESLPRRKLYDFADFYCAGAALDRGADPYRYEPLHRCEHIVNSAAAYRSDPAHVVPAPLPPYDFPPLMLLARLPFATARTIDAAAIVVAIAAAIGGLVLLAVPLDVAVLALLFPGGYVLLSAGQVVPFALVAMVFSGVTLARGRPALAGVFAAFTAIEPHLGLPVCVAMFLWAPRSRLALIATALVFASIGALLVGFGGIAEFATRVLPAQAAAESGYVYQYSLTYLLRTLGAPASAALACGEVSYFVMLAVGVWLGARTAIRLGRPELVAYVPAACSVMAGPYVHMVDLAFAIPAALVLACHLHGVWRNVALIALCLLAVPWIPVWVTKKLFLATLFVVAALLARLRARAAVAIPSFFAIAVAIYLLELAPPAPLVAKTVGDFGAADLAQRAWDAYVERLGSGGITWLLVKIPTWLGLTGVLAAGLASIAEPAMTVPP
jgi:hypothetical protein